MIDELDVFIRLECRESFEGMLQSAIRDVLDESRKEPGCLSIQAYMATDRPRLFYIHSRWTDEAAFELHATLPHTLKFLKITDETCESREVTRAMLFD